MADNREKLKKMAVEGAMDWISSNYDLEEEQKIGVGSGSTVSHVFRGLADYENLTAVPASDSTREGLVEHGVRVAELEDVSGDLIFDIDGADEVDPNLNLIKGGGGCHYREKMVANRSKDLLIVVDESKLVDYLGQKFPLPVEFLPSETEAVRKNLMDYGKPKLREEDGQPVETDNLNYIFDLELQSELDIDEMESWEEELNKIEGVVENGFFVNRHADLVFVGTSEGVEILERGEPT
ncbi:MAG: ribose-5-phosphate isomerase RpiA [Candidatus Acetothermia bacterium]